MGLGRSESQWVLPSSFLCHVAIHISIFFPGCSVFLRHPLHPFFCLTDFLRLFTGFAVVTLIWDFTFQPRLSLLIKLLFWNPLAHIPGQGILLHPCSSASCKPPLALHRKPTCCGSKGKMNWLYLEASSSSAAATEISKINLLGCGIISIIPSGNNYDLVRIYLQMF